MVMIASHRILVSQKNNSADLSMAASELRDSQEILKSQDSLTSVAIDPEEATQ